LRRVALAAASLAIAALVPALLVASSSAQDSGDNEIPPGDRIEAEAGKCGEQDCILVTPSETAKEKDPDKYGGPRPEMDELIRGSNGGIPIEVLKDLCRALPTEKQDSSPTCQSSKEPSETQPPDAEINDGGQS